MRKIIGLILIIGAIVAFPPLGAILALLVGLSLLESY